MRTLGFLLLALQGEGTPTPSLNGGMIGLVKSVPALVVLGLLLVLSVVSWGIIFYKLLSFSRIQSQSGRFLEIFPRSTKFSEVQAVCQSLNDSPLVGIFQAGYAELNLQLRQPNAAAANPGAAAPRAVLKSLAGVDRALLRASNVEVSKLEKRITFLATTAAIAPFIGLFGTVWGIIGAVTMKMISSTSITSTSGTTLISASEVVTRGPRPRRPPPASWLTACTLGIR